MASAVQEECRARLETDRAELQQSIDELQGGDMSAEEAAEASALVDTLRETLAEIEDALLKITNVTYGTCESCKGPISDERLLEVPAARLCEDCADVQATVLTTNRDVD
jgi:RNA polymerase-binding transcription factor DksA